MTALYLVSSSLLILLFFYADSIGWKVIDPEATGSHKPSGPGQHYHK